MKLGFFTMPIHPLDKDWRQSLREDQEAFILADELGFSEGYCGEHATDQAENITSCMLFLATLIDRTKTMKLGTGTVNLPNSHPVAGALEHRHARPHAGRPLPVRHQPRRAHLGCGGVREPGPGPPGHVPRMHQHDPRDLGTRGAVSDRGQVLERHDERTIVADIGQGIMPKPLQRPHPPIVVTAVAPLSKGVTEAAARGWEPISANFLMPAWVKSHWPKYVEGCDRGGRVADPANWRVARSVFVADDMATARAYATDPNSPYRFYYSQMLTKMKRANRLELFKTSRDMPDAEVTLDFVCDKLVTWGTPDKVADELLAFRGEVGEFGTMLYAGHDWADRDLGRRSMILLAEKVLPQVNAGSPRRAAEAAE
jgi:alkanesulfonate monooxygenase SsuD/methylene tetrahydromethanopterin reductase-like flavin-dependent oxidoreductase (luciferase family)